MESVGVLDQGWDINNYRDLYSIAKGREFDETDEDLMETARSKVPSDVYG